MTKETFEKILLEAVDDALASLGESAKQSIYFHLEKKFQIRKNDIPTRLTDFANGLENIFGIGAKFLEILIMRKLYEKTGQTMKWDESKELMFVEYVSMAKKSYLRKKAVKTVNI